VPDKKLLTAAALTAALAAGGAGGALLGLPLITSAQTSDDSTTTEAPDEGGRLHRGGPRFGLEAAAEALGVSADDLRRALEDGKTIADVAEEGGVDLQTVIDAMVADATERIDERAAEAKEDLPERINDLVNGEVPDHPGPGPRGGIRAGLSAAAEALGISVDDLRSALRDDKTIADVAAEHGVDVQAVIDAMVAEATERIDQAVADGDVDADRAAELEADLPERLTALVNGELPRFGPGD
jgi:uncharacterized protein YidB (DUF937 family)